MWNNSTMNRMITKVKMNQTMMINNIINIFGRAIRRRG